MYKKRELVTEWAQEEGVTVTELLGYMLHLENWNLNKPNAAIGWKLFTDNIVTDRPEVTLNEAVWIIEKSGMSQVIWQEIRLRLLDIIWLPPVMNIRTENNKHRQTLVEYHHGVKADLKQCLRLTIIERLQFLDLSQLNQDSLQIFFEFCWGLDGSGQHSDYHQLSKTTFSTNQIMSVCFSIKEITIVDGSGVTILWNSSTSGANKPQNTRPLALFPAKENQELLEVFVPIVETEIRNVKDVGIEVEINKHPVKASCINTHLSMADGKMVTALLNCGGAYCTMCIV